MIYILRDFADGTPGKEVEEEMKLVRQQWPKAVLCIRLAECANSTEAESALAKDTAIIDQSDMDEHLTITGQRIFPVVMRKVEIPNGK